MLLEHKVPQLMMSCDSHVTHEVSVEKATQVSKKSQLPSVQQNGVVVNGNGIANGHN